MSVEANIVSREKLDVILVPANAVVNNSAVTIENDRARLRKVEIGIRGTGFVEILEGASEGELVASPATTNIKNGVADPFASRGTGGAVNLILTIAWTHVRHRARQTLVAIAGVTTGVGFSIMMAAMMEGSQDDFIRTLVDALPHISVTDELREPNRNLPTSSIEPPNFTA